MKKKRVLLGITGLLALLVFSSILNTPFELPIPIQTQKNTPVALHATSETGVLRWNTTWGNTTDDRGYGLVIDPNGSIYCTGYTNSFGAGGYDLLLVKYAPNGTQLWNTTWGGSNDDKGWGITMDTNGSLYCVGETESFGAGGKDFALVKFAPNGTRLWNVTWGGSNYDWGRGVAVDTNGSIYCTGSIASFGAGSNDLGLAKFDPSGTRLWNITWGGSNVDYSNGVVVDANGSIYSSGLTKSFGAGNDDFSLVKFASNKTLLWNITWGGPDIDYGYELTMDANGFVYCTGARSFGSNTDLALLKFAPNGTRLWNTTRGGSDTDIGWDVAIDVNGSLYCTGYTKSFGAGNNDLVLVKFGPTGTQLGSATWGGSNSDTGADLALDANGSIYCVGFTTSFGAGGFDLVLAKFGFQQGLNLNVVANATTLITNQWIQLTVSCSNLSAENVSRLWFNNPFDGINYTLATNFTGTQIHYLNFTSASAGTFIFKFWANSSSGMGIIIEKEIMITWNEPQPPDWRLITLIIVIITVIGVLALVIIMRRRKKKKKTA